jgi:alkylation response protein AidB-like acyl-CoA dehydrogenase
MAGGEFLIKETSFKNVFIPEEWSEEQQMMAQSCVEFLDSEIEPNLERIDKMEEGLMPSLLEKAGELGLLSISIPESYGGFGGDFNTSLYIQEKLGAGYSFAVALAAHTGIGTLPILYFGSEEQKAKYLPKLSSGEWKASYCLTEPGSGSDALAAKTKAILSADGSHYSITGQKMWITNAGFADVFIVFAQVDGDKFTGFIVERGQEGLSFGNEEHKMGIKGSSTRQVFLSEVKVPTSNVLGEIGKGHLIAFNILNVGRIKLGAAALGASKNTVKLAVKYANERQQFQMSISKFGAIKYKLAEQAIRIYASESAMYRAGAEIGEMEHKALAGGKPFASAVLDAAQEYAIECALLKVSCSETLDYVVDEGVQIYGGYGFSADFPMDRSYRDSRINRIFEGTNEINRLLMLDMYMKRAMKGEIDMLGAAMGVQKELMGIPEFGDADTTPFAAEKKIIGNLKKAILMTAGAAAQKFMQKLAHEQEIIMNISDMLIQVYEAESALLRAEKLADMGHKSADIRKKMAQVYLFDAVDKVNKAGKDAIVSFAEGDEMKMMLLGLKRFTKMEPVNVKVLRREIADAMIAANDWIY